MTFPLFLQQQLAQPWLIQPAYVQQMLPTLVGMLRGEGSGGNANIDFSERREALRPQLAQLGLDGGLTMGPRAARAQVGGQAKPDGAVTILVLSVKGPMMKDDQECGPSGTETLRRNLKQAYADPDIDGVLLKFDTPGGQAYGTASLADTIDERNKPVGGFVDDGLCCSAGIWPGSSCDFLIASHGTCRVGSIGTMNSWADMQPAYEKLGVVFHEVYATESTQKNAASRAADKGDYKLLIEWLDDLNAAFVGHVKDRIGSRLDMKKAEKAGLFNGADMPASEALGFGLITEIGSFETALQRVADLARQNTTGGSGGASAASNNSTQMPIFGKSKFPKLAAMAGQSAEQVSPEAITEANQELAAEGVTAVALISEAQLEAERAQAAAAATTETAAQLTAANDRAQELREQLTVSQSASTTLLADLNDARNEAHAATERATTAEANATQLAAELATVQAEAERLGALSGARTSAPFSDDESEIHEGKASASGYDPNHEHNRTAANLLGE